MKIKMDTYTRQLYEDFISALSDRLRETADKTVSRLEEINNSLDALRDQVKEPDEDILNKLDGLVIQLNDILKEHDNKLLSNISQIMDAHKSIIQTSIILGQSQTGTLLDSLNTQIGSLSKEIETKHDNIIDSVTRNLDTMKDQLNFDIESVIRDNGESITNRVNDFTRSKNEILTDSLLSSIQSVSSVIEELQDGLLRELAKGNQRLDDRISRAVGIASIQMRRIRFTEHLIYKALKASMDSFLEYRVHTEEKLSSIESVNLEQHAVSNQSLELNKLINSEISRLNTYVVSSDHDSISDLINLSISEARTKIEEVIKRVSQVIDTYYPEMKDFITVKNQEVSDRVIGDLTNKSDEQRNNILEAINTSETKQTERTLTARKDVIDKVDALATMLKDHHNELMQSFNVLQQELISMHQGLCDQTDALGATISDHHNEISQTLSFLHQELISRHNDLKDKNNELTEQVNTNQELLIWILTPWYKKIFRRKNGKPQILVRKPVVEPEDN
ncbi:MAG TPA: hypothetical protein PLQ80_01855 [Candidatus Syntrophosphaera sp.]|nr:hypothetical protein [Candidatus Syntrophosphaera sp.]